MKRMQATYMVIRYLPDVPREEFVNVGVVLICPDVSYQGIRVIETFGEGSRAKLLGGDGLFVQHSLVKLRNAIENKRVDDLLGSKLAPEGRLSPKGMLDLYQIYCNNIRFSQPRTAVTENPELTLEKLFQEYVGQQQVKIESKSITRKRIRQHVVSVFDSFGLFAFGSASVNQDWPLPIPTAPTVDLAYKNDVWHCYQAISFVVRERDFTNMVSAYRTTARDAQQVGGVVSGSQFMALVYKPSVVTEKVRNLEAALKHDGIAVADYREAPAIAQQIKKDLEAHQLPLRG